VRSTQTTRTSVASRSSCCWAFERLRRAAGHAQTAVKEQRHVVAPPRSRRARCRGFEGEAERVAQEAQQDKPVKEAQAGVENAKVARKQAKDNLTALSGPGARDDRAAPRGAGRAALTQQQRAAYEALTAQVAEAEAGWSRARHTSCRSPPDRVLAASEREMDLRRADTSALFRLREKTEHVSHHRQLA